MDLRLRTIQPGDSWQVFAGGRDQIAHVLAGQAWIAVGDAAYRLRRDSVIVLTGDDRALVTAVVATRVLDVASAEVVGRP